MINLDYQSRKPIYEQIVNQFERLISLGILKPKQQVYSIRELATSLGDNPNTVKKAYEAIENNDANKAEAVSLATKKIDQAAAKNIMHKNKAARMKSSLATKANA